MNRRRTIARNFKYSNSKFQIKWCRGGWISIEIDIHTTNIFNIFTFQIAKGRIENTVESDDKHRSVPTKGVFTEAYFCIKSLLLLVK